jgi:hypothetical protein
MANDIGRVRSPYGSRKTILKRRALLAGAGALASTTALAQSGIPDGTSIILNSSRQLQATGSGATGGVIYDFPTNGSGLGVPAILRQTVDFSRVTSVTVGSGQSTGTRTNTQTAMQTALNYYSTENVFYVLPPGVYEIYGSTALTIPYSAKSLVWRGAGEAAQINQFYTTSPGVVVLQIGDSTANNYLINADIEGVNLQYGASQTSNTNTAYVAFGPSAYCRFNEIYGGSPGSGSGPFNPAYYGVWFQGVTTPTFSSNFSKMEIQGAQHDLAHWDGFGTGGVIDNFYFGGGAGSNTLSPPAVANSVMNMNLTVNMGGSNEWDFNQVNTEWVTGTGAAANSAAMNITGWLGLCIRHWHQEGLNWVSGGGTAVINITWSDTFMKIENLGMYNFNITSANIGSNPFSFLWDYVPQNNTMLITTLILRASPFTQDPSVINVATTLYTAGGSGGSASSMQILGCYINDNNGTSGLDGLLSIDGNMTVTSSAFLVPLSFVSYIYNSTASQLIGAVINVSSTYTHYSQLDRATLILGPSGTYNVNFALTATSTSGTPAPAPGALVRVLRPSYSSGTVTFLNGGSSIGGGTTNSGTGELNFRVNTSGAWVTVTGVN